MPFQRASYHQQLTPKHQQQRDPELCPVCSNFIIEVDSVGHQRWPSRDWTFFRCEIEDLLVNSQAGCRLCRFLESTFSLSWLANSQNRYKGGWLQLSADTYAHSLYQRRRPTITALLQLPQARPAIRTLLMHNVKRPRYHHPTQFNTYNQPLFQPDPVNTALINTWLATCRAHHSCSLPSSAYTPPRLLSVGTLNSPHLKLIAPTVATRYAALSYVRGQSSFSHLTSTNFTTYLSSIPDSLPRTFTEAIHLTRSLNIPHIYIHALCVQQDSASDLVRSAEDSAHIFSNAEVTICATGSVDVHGGLFHPQDVVVGCRERCGTPETGTPTSVGGQDADGWVRLDRAEGRELAREGLNQRAWAFGEEVVSGRRLMFGSGGVVWSCGECAEGEVCVQGSEMQVEREVPGWTRVVEEVSGRRASEQAHRLLCVAGLGKLKMEKEGGQYIAGLWRGKLETQLLWHQVRGSKKRRAAHGEEKREPSWSWISVDGAVEFTRRDIPGNEAYVPSYVGSARCEVVWSVVDCQVELEFDKFKFGPVLCGVLTIRAPLSEAQLVTGGSYGTASRNAVVTVADGGRTISLGKALLDEPERRLPKKVFCLVATVDAEERVPSEGLLVTPVEDNVERNWKRFRRIGMFRSTPPGDGWREEQLALRSWYTRAEEATIFVV
ncbi:hypothetical protein OQA88_610 [Cercophora sp. LCS_1]